MCQLSCCFELLADLWSTADLLLEFSHDFFALLLFEQTLPHHRFEHVLPSIDGHS